MPNKVKFSLVLSDFIPLILIGLAVGQMPNAKFQRKTGFEKQGNLTQDTKLVFEFCEIIFVIEAAVV